MTEQEKMAARNAERRSLCVEYAKNFERRNWIIKRLGELSELSNNAACAERLEAELIERRRAERRVITMPQGVIEDDACCNDSYAVGLVGELK